jgi:lipoprotein NlpD
LTRSGHIASLVALFALFALVGCIPAGVPKNVGTSQYPAQSAEQPKLEMPAIDTVFNEKPVWESRPVVANARTVAASEYSVAPGDSLLRIGEKTGAGLENIARVNDIEAPYTIRVGQRLIIPQGRYHRVNPGESGIAIARAYAVPWSRIVDLNGLSEPFRLRSGQSLLLPPDAGDERRVDERAAAFKLDIDDILTGGEPANDIGGAAVRAVDAPRQPLSPNVAVRDPAQFSGAFTWPAYGRVEIPFGPRGAGDINDGIDISVGQNAPIVAASDGVVAFVGDNVAGYGGVIMLRHGGGWITAYGRAAAASVTRGQAVRKGQIIGRAGSGATPLLHFEMRQNRKPVNPALHLPKQ